MQIIPKKTASVETHWKKELANTFNDLNELLNFLQIKEKNIPLAYKQHIEYLAAESDSENNNIHTFNGNTQNKNTINIQPPKSIINKHNGARKLFPMRVPRPFAALMEKGNWHDPLLQQVIPQNAEFEEKLGFVSDPLEEQNGAVEGLIHKYKSRVLIVVKGGCAVNCRYCFRRHFPYQSNQLNKKKYEQILDYIRNDTHINEVILSGGDPLMAKDEHLRWLIQALNQIRNIKRIRIHTRLPVVIPSRINDEFISVVSSCLSKLIMVLHINHPNEITDELKSKMDWLKQNNVTLLNQSVLLAGINNNANVLSELSEALFAANILPYYLHLLDPVKGASHFDVSKNEAIQIMSELYNTLPGFLVPKLVQELPNRKSKTPIDLGLE